MGFALSGLKRPLRDVPVSQSGDTILVANPKIMLDIAFLKAA